MNREKDWCFFAEKRLCCALEGNVGTAAYLDVFGSIYAVMKELKKQGYTVEERDHMGASYQHFCGSACLFFHDLPILSYKCSFAQFSTPTSPVVLLHTERSKMTVGCG